MTNQKMTEIINEFCEWSVMLASAGIILDENAINKTGGTAIYFTYPEVYAEDCRTINEEYEDAVYVEGVEGLAGNPKDVSMTLLNEFLLYYSAVYNLENMKIFDDDDIDEALAEIIEMAKKYAPYYMAEESLLNEQETDAEIILSESFQ